MGSGAAGPYRDEIIGDHWPEVPPSDWYRLQTVARDAADAVDPQEAERARKLFSERVPASVGLEPAKNDMGVQQANMRAVVDGLVLASDIFGKIGDTVHRARHKMLDIVEEADADIRQVRDEETDSDGNEDKAAERRRIAAIIRQARSDVADVERNALRMLDSQGLPELEELARLLGQPNPWARGHGPGSSGHPQRRQAGGPGAGGRSRSPGTPIDRVPPSLRDVLPRLPFLRDLIRLDPGQLEHSPLPFGDLRDRLLGEPPAGADPMVEPPAAAPGGVPPATADPAGPAPGYGPGQGQGQGPGQGAGWDSGSPSRSAPGPVDDEPADSGPVADTGGAHETDSPVVAEKPDSHSGHVGIGTRDDDENDIGAAKSDRTSVFGGAAGTEDPGRDTESGTYGPAGAPMLPAGIAAGPGAVLPPLGVSGPGPVAPPPVDRPNIVAAQANPAVSGADGRGGPPDSRITAPAAKGPAVTGPPGAPVAAPAAKSQPPLRLPGTARQGSDEVVRDAVGAAMIAASVPAFVLGERVDGDLVLARSLLSSLLAVAGDSALGVDWAVAILRHSSGVTAFVTSNEGRGWLPPGVYLPRELSTPWVWSESTGSGWEGVADPARVLAEFGVAWGAKTGARLSALVSSQPIDRALGAQLGAVPTEGPVAPAAVMDFGSPAVGLADRLELVGSPELVARATTVPGDRIGARCSELARDAHKRVAALGRAQDGLGAGDIRTGVLQTIERREAVSDEGWDAVRDIDALIAASMMPLRADVSRVTLGELHAESAGRSESAALRALLCQRRCNELLLLLAGEPTRQTLRDAVYAHAQLIELGAGVPLPAQAPPPPRTSSVSVGPRR